jgi:hypothetical protein
MCLSCRVPVPRTATTGAVTNQGPTDPENTVPPDFVGENEDIGDPAGAPSVPVPQGLLTMSAAYAHQVASVGAGELSVLAPLALQARPRLQERPFVLPAVQARTGLQQKQQRSQT